MQKENIPIGNYDIRELKAPAGHVIQFKPQSIRIDENKVCTYKCTDQAQYYPIDLIFQKKIKKQINQKLKERQHWKTLNFLLSIIPDIMKKNPADSGVTPVREWIMKTDSEGRIRMKEEQKSVEIRFIKTRKEKLFFRLELLHFRK